MGRVIFVLLPGLLHQLITDPGSRRAALGEAALHLAETSRARLSVTQSCLTLVTSWTVACQTPLSMGFSRHESWSGLPFPPPGGLPDPGLDLHLLHWQAESLPLATSVALMGVIKEAACNRHHPPLLHRKGRRRLGCRTPSRERRQVSLGEESWHPSGTFRGLREALTHGLSLHSEALPRLATMPRHPLTAFLVGSGALNAGMRLGLPVPSFLCCHVCAWAHAVTFVELNIILPSFPAGKKRNPGLKIPKEAFEQPQTSST